MCVCDIDLGVFWHITAWSPAQLLFSALSAQSPATTCLNRVWCWQVQTEMMGDIHHYAWRARHRNQTVYINRRDGERFGNWTHQECAVSPCLCTAGTQADPAITKVPTRPAL